ncbi:286872e0-f7b9-4aa2-91ae-c5a2f8240782 [Thermothielavioides terrestris]|uniref:286872e0-f7b9-4aa2-91ae-c5a2f8240782 n=1 Tax=Thermothielavioides terrestris TaxID=2587410 RepID=A0A446BW87_9PEZI|nr:286872e0-f7b9-4aa2-91ae-c5a2f8240782 [Thermothielavioides terrestris]
MASATATAPAGTETFSVNPSPDEIALCTIDTCPINSSFYMYRLSLATTWLPFLLGIACEIVGYAGRIKSYYNQWEETGFFMQIIGLTIGPAFLSASVYLCLSRIVAIYGPANSRIPAGWYTRIFIPCDIVSLVLQAGGGAAASVALDNHTSLDPGDNAMLAGLILQVVTLAIFVGLCADFGLRTWRRARAVGCAAALPQDAALARARASWAFRGFLAALGLAVLAIFWRSVYRSAELSQGWTGPLMYDQWMFVGFEGVMIVAAVSALLVFHPAVCLGELIELHAETVRAMAGQEEEELGQEREMVKFARGVAGGGSSDDNTEHGERKTPVP